MTDNPGIHVLTDARWASLEPLIDEVRPHCKVPHEDLRRDCREFRVWDRTMLLREPSYVATQTAPDPG
jgi:transposase